MKNLIRSLFVAFALVLVLPSAAMAEHYWKLDMFQPTGAITGNSFNVEYKVLSIERNDDFTVNLFQNDAVIGTQNTTKDYGDSGVFAVTVPGPGTYRYHVSAQSSFDGTTKSTPDRTLTVTTTPSGGTTTVFVNQANANPGATNAAAAGGAPGDAAAAGAVAGAAAGQNGQVNAEGQTKTTENGDVLGTEKKNEEKKNEKSGMSDNWPLALLAVAIAAGAGGYYYIQRTGNNPFKRGN